MKKHRDSDKSSAIAPLPPSRALEWMWQYLRDVPHPHVLDCGPVHQTTVDILLKRGAKVYVADLLTPAWHHKSGLVRQQDGTKTFAVDEFLQNLPPVPAGSLSVLACWHLLDLVPPNALSDVIARLWSYLQPGGVLFCLLRESRLTAGAETRWWLESLTVLGSSEGREIPFLYPVLTNREIERLVPGGNVKTFLTRYARREMIAIKQNVPATPGSNPS